MKKPLQQPYLLQQLLYTDKRLVANMDNLKLLSDIQLPKSLSLKSSLHTSNTVSHCSYSN